MCSASISPQSMVSLFIFLSVFQRKEGFNCDEVQFIFFFHFLVVLLCHIQKVWLIQHHKDIFLCFVLEHLLFYIEHSGLWYILGSCLYVVQGIVKVLFFFGISMSNCSSTIFQLRDSICSIGSLWTLYFIFITSFKNCISYLHWPRTEFWTLAINYSNDLGRKQGWREGNKKQDKQTQLKISGLLTLACLLAEGSTSLTHSPRKVWAWGPSWGRHS